MFSTQKRDKKEFIILSSPLPKLSSTMSQTEQRVTESSPVPPKIDQIDIPSSSFTSERLAVSANIKVTNVGNVGAIDSTPDEQVIVENPSNIVLSSRRNSSQVLLPNLPSGNSRRVSISPAALPRNEEDDWVNIDDDDAPLELALDPQHNSMGTYKNIL